ncbi:hypothetical protein [Acaryochloris sp. IP29b_bin.137]|uniref:hypothetical protein n=1 Tax=Acaryochloris sp. IP29b_bin.137 TaxID=2969217 RepID=UPI00260883C2|nr:hypothetical protein [Acaryochloris sp. IP29b_bin.137]
MFDRRDELFQVILNKAFQMLEHFVLGIELPTWLAPLSMLGLLAAFIRLLPSIQKGSILAGVGGYLLLGVLLVNAVALSLFLFVPGKLITFKTPSSAQAGCHLLKILLMGFFVMLKSLVAVSLQVIFDLSVLILAVLTYPSRRTPIYLNPC